MNEFIEAFTDSVRDGTFIELVLSRPWRDGRAVDESAEKITARPVELKTGRHIQITRHEARRDTHENVPLDGASEAVARLFGASFRNGHLFTTEADIIGKVKGESVRLQRRRPSKEAVDTSHNRDRNYLIPEGIPCPFLCEVGVMTADGRVRAARYDKFRQINRFLELVADIYASLPESGPVRVVDFGCGKSYLTFALHHLLTVIMQREVDIVGLELKSDVVAHCQEIAERLNCQGLRFVAGDMSTWEPAESVHLTVALHACDTATDVALARSVSWGTNAVLSVPCCHHEIASNLARSFLQPVQRHGILHERLSELITDGLRAELLEEHGYRTQVLEFIDLEHTQRNLLIRAVRRSADGAPERSGDSSVTRLLQTLGVESCTLRQLLSEG